MNTPSFQLPWDCGTRKGVFPLTARATVPPAAPTRVECRVICGQRENPEMEGVCAHQAERVYSPVPDEFLSGGKQVGVIPYLNIFSVIMLPSGYSGY